MSEDLPEPHMREMELGAELADFLQQEFERLGTPPVRWIHAFAYLFSGWMMESDSWPTALEQRESRMLTDDQKIQPLIDEIKELLAMRRAQQAQETKPS